MQIEVDQHATVLLFCELADLQLTGVRGRFPIHVTRTLHRLIGTNAVQFGSPPAACRSDFAAYGAQQLSESRLRIEARIHQYLMPDGHRLAAFGEAEWEPRGHLKA